MSTTEPIRRLTIEEVRAAIGKTGLALERCVTFDPARKCGCPIGVVARSNDLFRTHDYGIPDLWGMIEAIGLTPDYAAGLIDGFDNRDRVPCVPPAYDLGYADGRAIAAALLTTEAD